MSLSDAQLDRYARHIVLREIGGAGQLRLLGASVAVIGAGGLGSPLLQYLAAAGIGRITLFDDDTVSLSNLQRQTIYGTADLGRPKAVAAAEAVGRINPDAAVTPVAMRIGVADAEALLAGHDVIVDGCDNFATRLAVADVAQALRVPLVSAAVGPFEGQLAVYRGWEPERSCYRCFVGNDPSRNDASCADQGVLGALTGIVGSLAALETIRAIVPFGEDSASKLLLVDALSLRFRTVKLPRDPGCTNHSGAHPCAA